MEGKEAGLSTLAPAPGGHGPFWGVPGAQDSLLSQAGLQRAGEGHPRQEQREAWMPCRRTGSVLSERRRAAGGGGGQAQGFRFGSESDGMPLEGQGHSYVINYFRN